MDIRDIRDCPPYPTDVPHGALEMMFGWQKELLNEYIKIEGLPQYPINLDIKSNQTLIKDFSGRIVEELGESYESIEGLHLNHGLPKINERNTDLDKAQIQNANEEIADAIHFYLELMIFSDISIDDIITYLDTKITPILRVKILHLNTEGDLLKTLMMWASSNNGSLRHITEKAYCLLPDKVADDNEFLRGCRKTSLQFATKIAEMMWSITYQLQIARNALKNKPWKQTQMLTDKGVFKERTLEGFLNMFILMDFMGMTHQTIFEIYYKKNQVNCFRIRSKY